MKLQLRLLGGFKFSREGRSLEVKARKSKALITWLAINHREPTPRDRLAGLLWEEQNTTQARQNLRQTLADIRRTLGEDQSCLLAGNDTISLDLKRIECDAVSFLQALDGNERATAAELFGGRLLDGYALRAPAFEQWLSLEQEHFDRLAADNLEALMRASHHNEDYEQTLAYARALLRVDRLREDGHREIMRSLVKLGRASDAIKQYNSCKTLLAREIGVPPDPRTHDLYHEIMASRRMAPAAAPEKKAARSSAALAPELRHASVLAIASRGLDELINSVDADEMAAVLSELRDGISTSLERFKCLIPRRDDELTVAVFGVGDGPGDHIKEAVMAGQAVQEALSGCRLTSSYAVCTGQLMTRPGHDGGNLQVSGSALNQAVELASKAVVGDLIAPSNIINGLGTPISHEPLEEPKAPGVCCVVQLGAFERNSLLPMAGRKLELSQLNSLAQACQESGTGHAVLIRGMAGMGKSRLIEEFLTPLRETEWIISHAEVLETSAGEANLPHLTRSLMALEEGHDRQWLQTQGLAERGLGGADLEVMSKLLGLDPDADPTRSAIKATLGRIMRHLMTGRPLVTVIEDIHWADASTLQMVADLIAIGCDYPVLFVMSTRVENEPLDPTWRAAFADTPLFTIDLGPLREPEARNHCWAVVESEPAVNRTSRVEAIVARCIERAQGHPLFLEQSMRALLFTNDELPLSVQSVVEARLKQLPEQERLAVLTASVLGTSFPHQALVDLHGEFNLALLQHHRLLRKHGEDMLFDHALLREGVYRTLLRPKRRELHKQAADWYRQRNALNWVRHLIGAEDEQASMHCLSVAKAALDDNRPDRAAEILTLLDETNIEHHVKQEVLKLSDRLDL